MRLMRYGFLLACCCLLLNAQDLSGASWKKDLEKKITAAYKPTSISLWNGALKEGYDVLVVTHSDVWAWAARDAYSVYPRATVKDGIVTRQRDADTKSGAREFRKGERVVIYFLDVDSEDGADVIRIYLISVESTARQESGNTVTTRYKGGIDFLFPVGYLAKADFAEIQKTIGTVLVSEAEYKAMDVPVTVKLGMSPEEVEKNVGKPQKVLDLGNKKIHVYPDMKVIFVDGKVTDIQ